MVKNPKGLALLYGTTSAPGVQVDVQNMEATFSKLGFAIFSQLNRGKECLEAILAAASTYLDYTYMYLVHCHFVFYCSYTLCIGGHFKTIILLDYADHGCSDDTHTFICPKGSDKKEKVYVEGEILQRYPSEKSKPWGTKLASLVPRPFHLRLHSHANEKAWGRGYKLAYSSLIPASLMTV